MYAKNKEFGSEMPQKAVSLTEQWNYWMCGLFVMFWIFFFKWAVVSDDNLRAE